MRAVKAVAMRAAEAARVARAAEALARLSEAERVGVATRQAAQVVAAVGVSEEND